MFNSEHCGYEIVFLRPKIIYTQKTPAYGKILTAYVQKSHMMLHQA